MPWDIPDEVKRARSSSATRSEKDRSAARRKVTSKQRDEDVAVLDFETDPFDNANDVRVFPFLAVLKSRQFDTVIIWEEDRKAFIQAVLDTIQTLPRKFTIYAHNGGKFDFMFFVNRLRGAVMFKGRGIMSAHIGDHELRDSFHIIPEKLASFKKDDFDYNILRRELRGKPENRKKIITYCDHDAEYNLEIVLGFIERCGRKLTIGQASQSKLKEKGYDVAKFTDGFDARIRKFYFGGRVECLAGIGHFISDPENPYRLFDVNSMYPDAMVRYRHPIGGPRDYIVRRGQPGPDTFFIELDCENYGALVCRTEDGETSARRERGRFFTTIHEYKAAMELGLIDKVKINAVYDCPLHTTFDNFIIPTYEWKNTLKEKLDVFKKTGDTESHEYSRMKMDYMFSKFFLNSCYGKFAQNPRRFREHYLTAHGELPPDLETWNREGLGPVYENPEANYDIWERPTKRQGYNNVGVAASITGGARATLLRALAVAENPIYCDTDSIICTGLPCLELHPTKLGAWDIEDTFAEVVIAGKKLYACRPYIGKDKLRSKGVTIETWGDYHAMLAGEQRRYTMKGPTMTRAGGYAYMSREVRATGPKLGNVRLLKKRG